MKSIYNFVVTPKGSRYNNVKKVGDSELILNTEIQNYNYINKEAVVLSTPIIGETNIKKGDTVLVHHNIFRRWYNIKGEEKNSKSYFDENKYFAGIDQVYLYKRNNKWLAPKGYCFVKPLKSIDNFDTDNERKLIGVIKYTDGSYNKNELVGFMPGSEWEFVVDGERLYRVMTQFITIKYEYQGNEETYNPSWAQSG
tara:strand:- start:340 stop:930 length:591 start_codon:yes stop_codon:yes gene_type:complete